MARKATALDVARLARASRSAVSMVFSGRADGSVSKEAQERIWEAARQLEYSPNQIARSLRDQRSHVIGLVSNAAVTSAFDGAIIAGANALAERFGFLTLSTDTENDEHRTVENAQHPFNLGDEIRVPGCVDQVHGDPVDDERHHGGFDRDAALAFQRE